MLNFVEVNRFLGPDVKMTTNERPDASISPDSHIISISLGDSCSITFKDCCSNDEHSLNVSDNAMYSMSLKSQYYWSHRIEQPVLSETSVRYSIVFKSMRRNNKNSTIIIGDSNTHKIYFSHEEGRRSDLGKEIFGRRITAYTIEDIQPIDAIGFENIVIQVGLNNMKDRYAPSDGLLDIEGIFSQWLKKILQIRASCPYSRIIVAPIPPTKIRTLNNRAKTFNAILFGCVNKFWYELRFDSFLDDQHDLLDNNYGRYFKVENGRPDRIHFGRLGISKLSLMIREAILSPRYWVGRQSYASVASIHSTPSFPNNT